MKKRIIYAALVMLLSLLMSGCCLSHEWADETCTAPKTCTKCGKTDGEMLPHTWEDATCTSPKTCAECGTTEGDVLEHTWLDATCKAAQTCSVCGATEGVPLAHNWLDATCQSPKTCADCGAIEGEPLSHTYSWTVTTEPTYTFDGVKAGICEVCGNSVSETIEALTPEYHWNQPVDFPENSFKVGFYKDASNYWLEITSDTINTSQIIFLLKGRTTNYGFSVENLFEQGQTILDNATNAYESKGITYAEMYSQWLGYRWVYYMDIRDDKPGIIGIKINVDGQLEALAGIDILD